MKTAKELDKFYTVQEVSDTFVQDIQNIVGLDYDYVIEPSAGSGSILRPLKAIHNNVIGIDLVPETEGVLEMDFFDYEYPLPSSSNKIATVGNPPFGKRSKLAIDFFKKASLHSDMIAFIIPVTWEKYSIHKQLPEGWHLIFSERLPEDSFTLEGKSYRVRCCKQIWVNTKEFLRLGSL